MSLFVPTNYLSLEYGIYYDDASHVVVFKKNFISEEIEAAKCLSMIPYSSNLIYCYTNRTSNYALYRFMLYSFNNIVTDEFYAKEREYIFGKLATRYKNMKDEYDLYASSKVSFYSEELLTHQKDCSFYGFFRKENIYALEQGLGKSLLSIVISLVSDCKTNLIVCPAVCKWNWRDELVKWGITQLEITVLDTREGFSAPYERWIIVNYDVLEKYKDYLFYKKIDHIILDECHKSKNMDAKRTKVIHEFQANFQCKLSLLSGTPTPNKIEDIFSYLRLTSHPFGKSMKEFKKKFIDEIILPNGIKVTKGKNISYLNLCISNILIRRRKKGNIDIPDKTYHKLHFSLDEYKDDYNTYLKELVNNVKTKNPNNNDIELSIQRLNIISAKAKVKYVLQLARSIVDKEHDVFTDSKLIENHQVTVITNRKQIVKGKVVIFTVNTEPLDMLEAALGPSCIRVDGSTPPKRRVEMANKFRTSRTINYFISNLDAAGIGINLINPAKDKHLPPIADVIHLNFPFTMAQLEQGNDRVHRIGQYVPVNIYYCFADGSVDEKIFNIIKRKYDETSELIEGQKDEIDFSHINIETVDMIKEAILLDEIYTEKIKDVIHE